MPRWLAAFDSKIFFNCLMSEPKLRITEIFYSLQGETGNVGLPTVFIRLTGCPLRCQYCDTEYAFSGGRRMALPAILDTVKKYNTPYITVTGGEPLAQPDCLHLLTLLCDQALQVSLETSGAISLRPVDKRVCIVMDIKTPDSGEMASNHWQNLHYLNQKDQIKFVICSEDDYVWSKQQLARQELAAKCEVLFSPGSQQLAASQLAEWILRDQLNVRFQLQLHKVLWGDQPGK